MASTCEIPTDFTLVDEFDAPPFENTPAVRWMHSMTPRFGHSRDLLSLMQGSEDEQRDYLRGMIASSIAVFCFFLVWLILLLVLKSLGPSQAGLLSGEPKKFAAKPSEHASSSTELDTWQRQYDEANFKLRILRCLVWFAGFSIVTSSILMSINGVDSLTRSLSDGRESISIVQDLTNGGIKLIDSVMAQNEQTGTSVDELLQDVNMICPAVRDPICTDLSDTTTCNFDGIFADDSTALDELLQHFSAGDRSVYYKELNNVKDDLERFLVVVKDLDDKAKTFNWALWCAMVFSWFLAGLCMIIMVGLACRGPSIITCMRHWILVPTFGMVVILSFIFSIVFIMGSMALADLCVDNQGLDPAQNDISINVDSRILIILNRFQEQLSPMLVETASFYVSQCPPELVPQEVAEQLGFVVDTIPTLGSFSTLIESNIDGIQAICGFDEPQRLVDAASAANEQLCGIAQELDTIRLYFQCQNWYPLYSTSVHEAICYNGTDGFAWVAITQFVVVFMAAVILTLRAVFYDIPIATENDEEKSTGTVENDSPKSSFFGKSLPKVTPSADGFELTASPTSKSVGSF